MKHYAPNRSEPSIEVIVKMGVKWNWGQVLGEGVIVEVNEILKLLWKFKKIRGSAWI